MCWDGEPGVDGIEFCKKLEHIRELRNKAKQNGLEAPESFWYAPLEELSTIYNGCGPEWMSKFSRKALTFALRVFEPAILIHDYRFELSDGKTDAFNHANTEIYQNCVKQCKATYGWYNPWRYRWWRRAAIVWAFCQYGGWSAWTAAYDKNKDC